MGCFGNDINLSEYSVCTGFQHHPPDEEGYKRLMKRISLRINERDFWESIG